MLDLKISLKDCKFICNVYDKRDKFKFSVARLTPHFINHTLSVSVLFTITG